jgi:hypothetical protein
MQTKSSNGLQRWNEAAPQAHAKASSPIGPPAPPLRSSAGSSPARSELGTEGQPGDLKGRELDRLIAELKAGKAATLRGVRCAGGQEWRFTRAAKRR